MYNSVKGIIGNSTMSATKIISILISLVRLP
jgi:hypothetical protein